MIFDIDPDNGGEESFISLESEFGQAPVGMSAGTRNGKRRLVIGAGDPGAMEILVVLCPDCTATRLGTNMSHDAGCPLNSAVNRVIDADAAWFSAHRGTEVHVRPITLAEILDLRVNCVVPDEPGCANGTVTVVRVGPGLRMRELNIQLDPTDES